MSTLDLNTFCDYLMEAKAAMALTGAGISAESEIPTFRGVQGLWEKYDIMEFAHIDSFKSNPAKVWQMLLELDQTIINAKPNAGHLALAELERMGMLRMVVTQNVDNLHQAAGSKEVVEFHGNSQNFRCIECGRSYRRSAIDLDNLPPRCYCHGLIKPDVIFFGEAIPWAANLKAFEMAKRCDLILVIGTSAVVAPAGEIPVMAKQCGAKVVEINPEETVLTGSVSDLLLKGSASEVLSAAIEIIKKRRN